MSEGPTTVDDYIDRLPPRARDRVAELRALVRSTAPELDEEMKWGSPAYVHPDGVVMLVLSGHKEHANVVFTPSTRESFSTELTDFTTGKGSVKLPHDEDVPVDLLTRMIRHRIREYVDDGVKWR